METCHGNFRLPDPAKMEKALREAGRPLRGVHTFRDVRLDEHATWNDEFKTYDVDYLALHNDVKFYDEREAFFFLVAKEIATMCSYASRVPKAHVYMVETPYVSGEQHIFDFSVVEHCADGTNKLLYNGGILVDSTGVSAHH